MRMVLPLGIGAVCLLAAQLRLPPPGSPPNEPAKPIEKIAEKPPEKPALENSGKPMVVGYRCSEEDMNWAGLSCTDDEPCRFYVELSSVEAVGNKIFLAGNLHSNTVTLYSVVLASEDGGKTWREPYDRIRGAGLDHIQFVDFENGWISGQVLQPLPQDPFLLITGDGGKTWRNRPLFSESRMGSILQYWFTSATTGSLIVDRAESGDTGRYELYETPNGGDTWMVREITDKLPKLRRAPVINADWRIRADAPSKSFRIEHQAANRWNNVAAFSVPVATCGTPEHAAPAPPPEEPSPAPEQTPAPAPRAKAPPSLRKPR